MTLPKTPTFRLDGKRALVTGASSGIGLGCAVALAEAGAHVVMTARGAERLEGAVNEAATAGLSVEAQIMDVADIAATEAALEGEVYDILVNSAGMSRPTTAIDTPVEDYDAIMGANVRGAFFISRNVARGLIAAGRPGSIINISSQMGHVGGVERAVYSASKHAVEGFTKSMAIEWGPHGVRINTLCPTFIRTPLTEATFQRPERLAWIMDKIKLGRVGEVEDIMGPTVFLASDASALITGTHLLVDGGWTAG